MEKIELKQEDLIRNIFMLGYKDKAIAKKIYNPENFFVTEETFLKLLHTILSMKQFKFVSSMLIPLSLEYLDVKNSIPMYYEELLPKILLEECNHKTEAQQEFLAIFESIMRNNYEEEIFATFCRSSLFLDFIAGLSGIGSLNYSSRLQLSLPSLNIQDINNFIDCYPIIEKLKLKLDYENMPDNIKLWMEFQ